MLDIIDFIAYILYDVYLRKEEKIAKKSLRTLQILVALQKKHA